jgi:peptide/nickel transport system substrate-binding protein
VQKVSRNSGGIPTQITLGAWNRYALGRPKIKNITFKFFQDENSLLKALASKSVDSATGLSQAAAKNLVDNKTKVDEVSLPRVFGVFFNQNVAPVFLNKEARVALDMAAPKQTIVNNSLLGFGKVLNGPTPANIETNEEKLTGNAAAAKDYLLKNGWKENSEGILEKKTKTETVPLKFSISTSDAPELKTAADILKNAWNSMGAQVEVKVFEAGDLSQNVIKSRKYDALLFGEAVGEDSDLYPFWHSSERNDPGLNISIYTNISVDKALENLQVETDAQKIADNKATVFSEIQNDMPAVFLFSPDFLYVPASKVKNISFKNTSFQNERFLSVNKWNIETDKVWKIFEPQK